MALASGNEGVGSLSRFGQYWRRRGLLPFLFVCCLSCGSSAFASTLFERSLDLLHVKTASSFRDTYTFVVLGDSRGNDEMFTQALGVAARYNPLFILHTGDYSDSGTPVETEHFLSLVQAKVPDTPFFVVPGNHENRTVFQLLVGPLDFRVDLPPHGRLVAVDNSGYNMTEKQIHYLRKEVDADMKPSFVAFHIPPRTAKWAQHSFSSGAETVASLLAQRGVDRVFCGHIHMYDRDTLNGVQYIVTGGAGAPLAGRKYAGESVNHIVVVRVKNGQITEEVVKLEKTQ